MSPTLHQKDPGTRLLAKLSPELENLQLLRQLSFLCFFSLFFFFFFFFLAGFTGNYLN